MEAITLFCIIRHCCYDGNMNFDVQKYPPQLLLANYYPFLAGESAGPHWSESILYLLCLSGYGVVRCGPQEFELSSGAVLAVPWACPIEYRADRQDPFVVIGVHLEFLPWNQSAPSPPAHHNRSLNFKKYSMCAAPGPQPFTKPDLIRPVGFAQILKRAQDLVAAWDAKNSALSLRAQALLFILELQDPPDDYPQATGIMREILSYIELAFRKPLRRGDLANRAGMSESAFGAAFKEATGVPVIEYIIRRRMRHATELIKQSRLRMYEIARACGIEDEYYFSKLFKQHMGCSPLAYRKKMRLLSSPAFRTGLQKEK